MNGNEYYYRKVIGAIGCTMLFFLLLLNLFAFSDMALYSILSLLAFDFPIATVFYQLFYAGGYLFCFMLPVLLLRKLIGRGGYVYQPMRTSLRVSPWIFLMIPACVTLIFSAAYLNSAMVNIFGYEEFLSEVLLETGTEILAPYQWVLEFIVACVVPGFCEEFLFRGAIMSNCRPFGRSNAILISALLFSLMHQNAQQIFFAFVAGILLGIVYEKTGSIWSCTVIHIFNNFIATFESVIFYKIEDMFASNIVMILFECVLFILGIISLLFLIFHFFSKKSTLQNGVFGRELPEADGYAACPIAPKRAVRLFLTPSMVIFLSACILQIVFLILLAVGYQYVRM